ncbi:pyochelin synthetase [Undibacterium sp. GrIS 1.2]
MTAPLILSQLRRLGIAIELAGENLKINGRQDLLTPALIGQIKDEKANILNWLHLLDAATPVPLTDMQLAYLMGRENALELGGVSSHVYHEFEGYWEYERLQTALALVVARHDGLRMVIRIDGARVLPPHAISVTIPRVDLRSMTAAEQEAELSKMRQEMSHQVMDAERGLLVDIRLSQLDTNRMRLHVSHDGLVIDGLSMLILFQNMGQVYNNSEVCLSPLSTSFAEQMQLLNSARDSAQAKAARQYWRDAAPELPAAPQLPRLADPASLGTPRSVRQSVSLPRLQWEAFQRTVRAQGLSAAAALGAAFCEVLSRWSGGEDFSLNMTIANRVPVTTDVFEVIGNFTQPCPVPFRHHGHQSFVSRAKAFATALRAGIEHRHLSGIEVLQRYARPNQPTLRLPVTLNCAFGAPGADGLSRAFDAFGTRIYAVSQTPQVWLNAFAFETQDDLIIEFDAVAGLFPDAMVAQIGAALIRLLAALVIPQGWDQNEADLLPTETCTMRAAVNATAAAIPKRLLHDGFLERAQQTPGALAIVAPDAEISYGALLASASAIADWLRAQGLGHDQPVAIIMHKGWEQIAAALGTLMAGGCYLPIDAAFPLERITQIMALATPAAALVQTGSTSALSVPVLEVMAGMAADHTPYLPSNRPEQEQNSLAYILFTSGSTGTPKGVMIEHLSAVNLVTHINARFEITPQDRTFGISAFHFDLSVFDIFCTLDAGAALVLPAPDEIRAPESWSHRAAVHKVTVWNSVPAIVQMLLESNAGLPPALRLILMSGDKIPAPLPAALVRAKPELQVIAAGGPTETTVWNILIDVTAQPADALLVPYGFPITNNRYYVLDQRGRVCPDWVVGQLHAAGAGVARGYWRDSERSAKAFFEHLGLEEHLYATGDLGRVRPDGCIEILGRSDFQVKINGNRIELSEIDFLLSKHPDVDTAVACVIDTAAGQILTAFIVAKTGHSVDMDALREMLEQSLPAYMVPQIFSALDRLPLTDNAKVDRKALAAMRIDAVPSTEEERRVPSGNVETAIAAIWENVLKIPVTNAHLRYERLGGSSLSAVRIATEINRHFGVRLPLRELDRLNTVATQASYLSKHAIPTA